MTRLHQALGLPAPDEGAEPAPALLDGAREFLLGGGRCSLEEWARQSPVERRALALAGSALRGEPPGEGREHVAGELLSPGLPRVSQAWAVNAPASSAGWTSREANEASGRARLAAKRSLLEALLTRGFDLPKGLESLDEQLVRLSMAALIHAVATGFPLETAVERFERAYRVKEAAAPTGAAAARPRTRRRRARAASEPQAPSEVDAPGGASATAVKAPSRAPRPRARAPRAADEAADGAGPGPDSSQSDLPGQTALF